MKKMECQESSMPIYYVEKECRSQSQLKIIIIILNLTTAKHQYEKNYSCIYESIYLVTIINITLSVNNLSKL